MAETLIGTAALVAVRVGARTRGVRIILDRLRPARGSTASCPPHGEHASMARDNTAPALLR